MTTDPLARPRPGRVARALVFLVSRRAWVVLHRYAGLFMSLVLVAAAATGTILAFDPPLYNWLNPELVHVPLRHAPMLDPITLRERALAAEPRADISFAPIDYAPGEVQAFVLEPRTDPATGQPYALDSLMVYLDPYTGAVVAREKDYSYWPVTRRNFLRFVFAIHAGHIVGGDFGFRLFGVAALIWTVDCFVALFLTFPPGVMRHRDVVEREPRASWWKRWLPAWRFVWDGKPYRITYNLHRASGLWTWIMLFAFAASSVRFNLPQVYAWPMQALFGQHDVMDAMPTLAKPVASGMSWRQALATGERLAADQARIHGVRLRPAAHGVLWLQYDETRGLFSYPVHCDRDVGHHQPGMTVYFDGANGAFRGVDIATGDNIGETFTTWISAFHGAAFPSMWVHVLVAIMGIVITVLSLSGIYLWLKKRQARRRVLASLLLVISGVLPVSLRAQGISVVRGTVVLLDGTAAAGAHVGIEEVPEAKTTTDDAGRFSFAGLAPGRYTVIAKLIGQHPGRTAVTSRSGDTVTIRVRLGAPVQLAAIAIVRSRETYVADSAEAATKVPAPLMQVPGSIQVVSQAVLEDQQALRLDDALNTVAGVLPNTAGQENYDEYTVRGFDLMGVSYDDGLRQDEYELSGLPRDMANVEQIEVVKGPASVLYGQAEPGGLVNVVTKKPLATPLFMVDQQIGSFATYRTTLDASGPINTDKTVLYRFNLDYESSGSFRDFIHTRRVAAFPTLEIRPSARTSLTFEGSYGTGTFVGDDGIPFGSATHAPANVPIQRNYADANANMNYDYQGWIKLAGTQALSDQLSVRVTARSEYVRAPQPVGEYYGGDVDSLGYLQRASFVTTSYWHWADQGAADLTAKFKSVGTAHTVLVGFDVYYAHGGYSYNQTGFIYPPDSINIYAPVYSHRLPPLNPADTGSEQQTQIDGGVYLQDLITLPANVHILAGLRLDRAVTHESNLGPASTVNDHPPVTPRLGVLWQAWPELSVYASYTSNFGTTALGEVTKDSALLPAQSAQQYELGVKTQLFHRLSSTTSIYQLTKNNVPTPDPTDPAFVIAVGQARSRGIEEDVAWAVTPRWQIIGGYSYIEAHVTKDEGALQGQRVSGVPYNSGSLWTTYVVPTGSVSHLRFGAGVLARGDETDFSHEHIPGFGIANAMLGYDAHIAGRTIQLQCNVNNVFNKIYFFALSPGAANPGAPRGVIGSLRFLL